jgi:hypothetical protein
MVSSSTTQGPLLTNCTGALMVFGKKISLIDIGIKGSMVTSNGFRPITRKPMGTKVLVLGPQNPQVYSFWGCWVKSQGHIKLDCLNDF